jgi:hypothetical protein
MSDEITDERVRELAREVDEAHARAVTFAKNYVESMDLAARMKAASDRHADYERRCEEMTAERMRLATPLQRFMRMTLGDMWRWATRRTK